MHYLKTIIQSKININRSTVEFKDLLKKGKEWLQDNINRSTVEFKGQ